MQYTKYDVMLWLCVYRCGRDWELGCSLGFIEEYVKSIVATRHNSYPWLAQLYLQLMLQPLEPRYLFCGKWSFASCLFQRLVWAVLWIDLTIKQVMLRTLKGRWRMKRGYGFTETMKTVWIYAMHLCTEIHATNE